jgi:hypothetical protein
MVLLFDTPPCLSSAAAAAAAAAESGVLQAYEDGQSDEQVMKLIEGGAVATPLERRGEWA